MNKGKEQIRQTKRELIGKSTRAGHQKSTLQSLSVQCERPETKATHKDVVWNESHFACLFQASEQTFFYF